MNNTQPNPVNEFDVLEQKIDSLLDQIGKMDKEIRSLKTSEETLINERSELIEKNTLAKSRVEVMIARLKAMNHQ